MRTWIVVDLEATCWTAEEHPSLAAQQRNESEIIEIGAVQLDPERRQTISEFQTFVRPHRHPTLSDFCRQLTHIEQAQVDQAPSFDEAYGRFLQWMGGDAGAVLASWGRYDHNQLRRQALAAGLPEPRWVPLNIKNAFADWYRAHTGRRARHGLGRAIRELGWSFEGTAHRGIDDARNAARLFAHLRDPANASPVALRLLDLLRQRAPEPTNLAHARRRFPDAKAWWHPARKELLALDVIDELSDGRGLIPRQTETQAPPR
jgi:inhibitor of KinA sporulation pathway (predicted exonuclease)